MTITPGTAPVSVSAPSGLTTAILSEIAGVVLSVRIAVGDRVREGDEVALLESMKMEIPVIADTSGVIRSVDVVEHLAVQIDHVVATLCPDTPFTRD